MWHDGPVKLHVCPVLSFTPEVEEALRWFDRCYELQVTGLGTVQWVRTALPGSGGIGTQPEWLVLALKELQRINDDISNEELKSARATLKKGK